MSNSIPEDWSIAPIGDICNIAIGGTPSRSIPDYWDSTRTVGSPWVSIRDLNKPWIYETSEWITDAGIKNSNVKLVRKGTVIMSFKLSVGRVAFAGRDLYTNEAIAAFLPKRNNVYSDQFLYQGLQHWNLLENIDQAVKGVTLNKEKINQIDTVLPPLPEQQKIAAILSSVDDVIEKTRAQIDKLKDLKTGMMQELLTKGIGHTEFKDSPVGRIPVSWEVCTLGDLTKDSAFGPRFSSDFYSETGNFGCIRTTDMDENWDIDYSTVPLALLNFNEFQSHILRDGDLLVTRSGTCGVVDVFQEQPVPMVAAAFLIRFRLLDSVNPWFVRSVMMSTSTQESIQMLASGGVQKNLSGTNLKTLPLPLPSKEEQDEIVHCINSVSKKITLIEEKKDRLTSLKKALMQDLLTGKVRVNIGEKETAVA